MKFKINSNQIKTKVTLLKRSLNPNHSLPVLTGAYFKAFKNNTIEVRATDLYFGVKFKIKAKVEKPGDGVIQGQKLIEIINSLKDDLEIDFIQSDDRKKITLKTSQLKINLPLLKTEDYPEFPLVKGESFLVKLEQIKKINQYITSNASTDQTRPILTGVLLNFEKKHLIAAATDGYRLAFGKFLKEGDKKGSMIVPAKNIYDLEKTMIEEEVDSLVLEVDKKQHQAKCIISDTEIYLRLIDGEYPPYKKIIPDNFNLEVEIDSVELLENLKQAKIFSRSNSNIVQLRISQDKFEVYANSADMGDYRSYLSNVKIKGEVFDIAFNINYLIDIATKAGERKIIMMGVESLRPAKFMIENETNLTYIIMPIKVHNQV